MDDSLLEGSATLDVVERFISFQGEGILTGVPMFFIRLPLCNLKCKWCDTKYAWEDKGSKVSELDLIEEFKATKAKWICITGGEPLLCKVDSLVMELPRDVKINVQTNGTLEPTDILMQYTDLWSVSPKLTSSGNMNAIKYNVLEKLLVPGESELKFVLACFKDFIEIRGILEDLEGKVDIKHIPVVLQPNGNLLDNARFLTLMWGLTQDFASSRPNYDIRFILQQHRVVWKNKRGI